MLQTDTGAERTIQLSQRAVMEGLRLELTILSAATGPLGVAVPKSSSAAVAYFTVRWDSLVRNHDFVLGFPIYRSEQAFVAVIPIEWINDEDLLNHVDDRRDAEIQKRFAALLEHFAAVSTKLYDWATRPVATELPSVSGVPSTSLTRESIANLATASELEAAVCLSKISAVAQLRAPTGAQPIVVLPEGMSYSLRDPVNEATRRITGLVTHVLEDLNLILVDACWWIRLLGPCAKDLVGRTVTIEAVKERGKLPSTTYYALSLAEEQMTLLEAPAGV
ncbi:MAG: hypothetical protein ACT4PZ_17965 [Panacagrimonas sp.]